MIDIPEIKSLNKAISPELYRKNPFRVLGIGTRVSLPDMKRHFQKILVNLKFSNEYDQTGNMLPIFPSPDQETLREASSAIENPESRLINEFFWFWPVDEMEDRDEALNAMKQGNYQEAIDIWKNMGGTMGKSTICYHNLAVLSHALALDMDISGSEKLSPGQNKQMQAYWNDAYLYWCKCLNDSNMWLYVRQRIRELDDPLIPQGIERQMQSQLPYVILSINANKAKELMEDGKDADARMHLQTIRSSGFDKDTIDKVLVSSINPLRERVVTLCESASQKANADPVNGDSIVKELLDQCSKPLSVIDLFLDEKHPARETLHDKMALTINGIIVNYGERTKDWTKVLELLKKALPIAFGDVARNRINENIRIAEGNKNVNAGKVEPGYQYQPQTKPNKPQPAIRSSDRCWYCGKRHGDKSSAIEVVMYNNIDDLVDKFSSKEVDTMDAFKQYMDENTRIIKVPRCSKCQSVHKNGHLSTLIGSGIAIYLMWTWTMSTWNNMIISLVAAVIGYFIGAMVFMLAGSLIGVYNTKALTETQSYPEIADLKRKGWKELDLKKRKV